MQVGFKPTTAGGAHQLFACRPDIEIDLSEIESFGDVGFHPLAPQNARPAMGGFFRFWTAELQSRLGKLRFRAD